MASRQEWERTRLDLNPADDPAPVAESVAPADRVEPVAHPMVESEVVDSQARRVRVVRTVCTIINLVCGLFAVVLGLHIVLVMFEANPNNGFASLVESFSGAVSLGLRGLFTPDSAKLQVLFNDGLAAIAWLVIAGALTYAIRQFALPGPRRTVSYRRHVVR
ncbi:MAG TPA: hypothetical protein VFV67_13945 [Actinophytocola sp.]|uniref:hypothetical protein n=1 Tax=Actinophytocola sp. TaxID=1872138 RepID=UPI002DB6D7DF|nr:hypothetical protein [Actinophytocola sp.]HEU5471749.1 hypothetical protein [Actinophytocola sp.]